MRRPPREPPHTPQKVAFKSFVGQKNEGKTLLDFLAARFTYFSKADWEKRIQCSDVLVNNILAKPHQLLTRKDEVQYVALSQAEPKIPLNIPVLYEDDQILVVNKPPHIPMHPSGRYLRNTLIHLLQKQRKDSLLILSHRLDRETSGCCVLSKTHLAKEKMYWAFFNNEVKKTYWALTWGIPQNPHGIIDAPIGVAMAPGSTVKSAIRIKQAVGGGSPKTAKTKYALKGTKWIEATGWEPPPWPSLKRALKNEWKTPWPVSLIECKPVTGRTNQIRVHLAHIGSGIMGDKLYDPDESIFMKFKDNPPLLEGDKGSNFQKLPDSLKKRLVLDAHALHAKAIEFRHPKTGKWIEIEAPAPNSWQGLY